MKALIIKILTVVGLNIVAPVLGVVTAIILIYSWKLVEISRPR